MMALLLLFASGFAQKPIPASGSPGDPGQILEAIRAYAESYIQNLPNFICQQTTEQFEAGKKGKHWAKKNILVFRVAFDGVREQQTLELVNGHPPRFGSRQPAQKRLTTEGEFALLVARVFDTHSSAAFRWKAWEDWDGHHLAVYDYSIDKQHSTLKITLSDLAQAILAYHGSVYADPISGAIWRIADEVDDIPPELKLRSFGTSIDYGPVKLGNATYLLPREASVQVDTGSGYIKHNLYFSDYRKFEAQSIITFQSGSDDDAPKPKSGP
jgi:hypothetical protein